MHINDLNEPVLQRILNTAHYTATSQSPRLHMLRQLLLLSSVCRLWRRLVSVHLQSTVIMEYRPKRNNGTTQVSIQDRRKTAVSNSSGVWPTRTWSIKGNGAKNGSTDAKLKPRYQSKSLAVSEWATNLAVMPGQAAAKQATVLRIQAFVNAPDYADFVGTMEAAGFDKQSWDKIATIEFVDFATIHAMQGTAAAATALTSAGSPSSPRLPSIHEPSFENAASFLTKHVPNVREIASTTWDISAVNKCLATHLIKQYSQQLHIWAIQTLPTLISASHPKVTSNLTVLQIQTSQLQMLGPNSVPSAQLQVLKLHDADPFFAWTPFAASSDDSKTLKFSSLYSLTIDYEKDNVAHDTSRDDALRGGNNPQVTMGIDVRNIQFPSLTALAIRKVPYTYTSAWAMFLQSPLRNLYIAGKHAHVRYIDPKLLLNLESVDIHLYLTTHAQGKFTTMVKTLLTSQSTMRSAWIRHSEVFPISIPDSVGWSELKELNLTAYVPPSALLNLASQLPQLTTLIAQRIAKDLCEPALEESTKVDLTRLKPRLVASTSVRELQLHMVGGGLHVTTLQSICYILLSMPLVKRLAVKSGYWPKIQELAKLFSDSHPRLEHIEPVHQVPMQCKPLTFQ
ncbi:hypothetical protein FB645_001413 [Coemansia sp. IMI 203386]|nr:hypothetical protein FB645_001413 [Coemansia sp. IMI 203386]